MTQPLHPSEFITLTNLNNPIRISGYNMVPGTVVHLRNHVFVLVDVSKGSSPVACTSDGPLPYP